MACSQPPRGDLLRAERQYGWDAVGDRSLRWMQLRFEGGDQEDAGGENSAGVEVPARQGRRPMPITSISDCRATGGICGGAVLRAVRGYVGPGQEAVERKDGAGSTACSEQG